jgi:hypothetical protein
MNYAQRWTMAVALKQAYPRPETGAEDPAAAVPPPPVFVPVKEEIPGNEVIIRGLYAAAGLAVGVGAVLLLRKSRR